MLDIKKEQDNGTLTIALEGRLDTVTAPDLEAEIGESIEEITDLKFDMEALEYISSAGLRVLLSAQKNMAKKGTMTLYNVNDTVMEIFDVTGFADILTIE